MATTFTKQAASIMRTRSTRLKRAAAAILGHEAGEVLVSQKSFLAWCALPLSDNAVATIVSALYYLPQNFMIMLPRSIAKNIKLSGVITDRIQQYEEGSSNDEPSALADAVIGAETESSLAVMPASRYSAIAAKDFSFAVGRSPEAVASALLKLARD